MLRKLFSTFFLTAFALCSVTAQKASNVVVKAKELGNLAGYWQGTLNYSGTIIRKPYTTTAALIVKQMATPGQFEFVHIYVEDSNKVTDTFTLSEDGRKINKAAITSKLFTPEGNLEIITKLQSFDHDDSKASIVKQTYTIGKQIYTYKQQVQLEGDTTWLDRQDFVYKRKDCGNGK